MCHISIAVQLASGSTKCNGKIPVQNFNNYKVLKHCIDREVQSCLCAVLKNWLMLMIKKSVCFPAGKMIL